MDPRNCRIFITGGVRRLGRELVRHFSTIGAEVIAHYNRSAVQASELQEETGCQLFQADFASISMKDLATRLKEEVGPVDVLVNNASSFDKADWVQIDEAHWDREFDVNLKTPFFLSQFFGPQMKGRGRGKILNLSDIAGKRPYTAYLPYSIAKGALSLLTEALARLLAPEVQVNAIAPGIILPMEGLSEQELQKLIQKIPARRTATLQEFLQTVDFLLWQVDYITGQTIILDGGRSLTW